MINFNNLPNRRRLNKSIPVINFHKTIGNYFEKGLNKVI